MRTFKFYSPSKLYNTELSTIVTMLDIGPSDLNHLIAISFSSQQYCFQRIYYQIVSTVTMKNKMFKFTKTRLENGGERDMHNKDNKKYIKMLAGVLHGLCNSW